ncbi:MAG: hypothetical protein ATN35_08870 [Epulopiscium sp. Nele67-Bin004]|nr:MAG: hypothetical protein ATN35_08870 [Epulopiscium sp. Nele67-Bin004]
MGLNFPLNEPQQLTFHYHARNMYAFDEDWPVFQEMAQITNVFLKNTANPIGTNSVEQLQLQAVDGFPSDIYGGDNIASYFMQYGPEGAFVAISDYWDYVPNFRAYLDENPDVEATITAWDGNIYHIPYIQSGGVARTYFMRTDWLDNLGLEVPETVEQLEEVLIAFRDDDPNGNGIKDEIPYFNDNWMEMMRLVNLWDARCYGMDSYVEKVIPREDGTVYHAWVQDEFKEGVQNLSRWYDMGLIDKEIFTKGVAARVEYLPKDIGGMTHEWTPSTSAYNDAVDIDGFKFEIIAPPITDTGNQWEEHSRLRVKPDGWAVSTNCSDPEVALAYMDYIYSDYGQILSNYGVEGLTYEMIEGQPTFNDYVLNNDENVAVNIFLERYIGTQLKHGYLMDYEYEYQWTHEVGRAGVDLYTQNDYSVLQLPPLPWNVEQKKVIDTKLAGINMYTNEMVQKWILGDPSLIDAEWDTYLAELEKLGLQELLDTYQEAYTTYLSLIN